MTERDVVLRERAAFVRGLGMDEFSDRSEALACQLYPLPKITRPRVVRDKTGVTSVVEWRVVDGHLEHRWDEKMDWKRTFNDNGSGMFIYATRVKLLADLLANPTEEVEDAGV